MKLVPVTLAECRRFVAEHHRHNGPPRGWLFGVGVAYDHGGLAGVGVAGRPVARALCDGTTVEVTRTCTTANADRNSNSLLYGALCRAAKALGYRRVVTYTLASETGASLKASGFVREADLPARAGWASEQRNRYEADLFGNERRPPEAKVRWSRSLTG